MLPGMGMSELSAIPTISSPRLPRRLCPCRSESARMGAAKAMAMIRGGSEVAGGIDRRH